MDDIFESDSLDILGDDSEGIFTFKHTPKNIERAKADLLEKDLDVKILISMSIYLLKFKTT